MKKIELAWMRFEKEGAVTQIIYQNYVIGTVKISESATISEIMNAVETILIAAINKNGAPQ